MSNDGVLLLGGAGFIGSALASRLKQEKVPRLVFPLAGGIHAVGQCVLFEREVMV